MCVNIACSPGQFVYTGELEGPIHDPGLLQLATSYQIKTL